MQRPPDVLLFSCLIVSSLSTVHAQESPATVSRVRDLKTLIVATDAKSDSVILVPPATSVSVNRESEKKPAGADAVDLPSWLTKQAALNGLQSTDLRPWHIAVTYDQFDEDGDNVHSGVYEEYWAGVKKYKRIYKSDNLNQTDYAAEWPDRAQLQVRAEVIVPFSYADTLQGFHGRNVERSFSGYKLQCVLIERDSGISDPTKYCFERDGSILRYNRGWVGSRPSTNESCRFRGVTSRRKWMSPMVASRT